MSDRTFDVARHVDASDDNLVRAVWHGDDAALTALLQRYRPFVRAKARSYFLVGGDREDVIQEGMIGLYKAVRDYDPDREAGFRGFAELCVTRQIISAVKSATRQKHGPLNRYISFSSTAIDDEEAEQEMLENFVSDSADPADQVVSSSELELLDAYFADILSELEAEVLQRYVEGQSYSEIAGALGRHVKSIDNALQRIKRKLDAYLEERRVSEAV